MGNKTRVTALDLRIGGEYHFDLTSPAGEQSFIAGVYLEIARPNRLVFTWVSGGTRNEQTVVTVEFVEQGEHTEIRLTHDRLADEAMVLLHQSGWRSCLDRLPQILEEE